MCFCLQDASETSNNSPLPTHHLAWFQCQSHSLGWAKSQSLFGERRRKQCHSKGPPESCRGTKHNNWFGKVCWYWWLSAQTILTVQCGQSWINYFILTLLQCWQCHWHLGLLFLALASLQWVPSCLLRFWGSEAAAQSSTWTLSQPYRKSNDVIIW